VIPWLIYELLRRLALSTIVSSSRMYGTPEKHPHRFKA